MNLTVRTLPDFNKPPLIEVALSVQFDMLQDLSVAHLGVLWEKKFRPKFPKTEQHGPLKPLLESFTRPTGPDQPVRFEFLDSPPTPRLWFLNSEETELIQIQPDRFIRNWRKQRDTEIYPRYDELRKKFCKDLDSFREFLREEGLPDINPAQCEVTYVNHITPNQGWDKHGQAHKIISLLSSPAKHAFPSEPEDIRLFAKYSILDNSAQPIGRLHVTFEPAFRRKDDTPLYVLTLIARGHPAGQTIDGVLSFFDKGHELIVRGFTSVTTPEMHQIWERVR